MPIFDVRQGSLNAARASVVTRDHQYERCAELSMAGASDAVSFIVRTSNTPVGEKAFVDAFKADMLNAASTPEIAFRNALWPVRAGFFFVGANGSHLDSPKHILREVESGGLFQSSKFWVRWYRGFLEGTPLDWDLQKAVALIPDEVWEAGPDRVARKIEEIEAQYLSERLPQAERIELNPDTGKFRAVPIPVAKPDLLGATVSQVTDALDDALANPSNGLTERSREARVLRRTIDRHGNDPQRIEMDFVSVALGLRRQIEETDELPKSEENNALLTSVEQGALGIRATHPDVAENREILAQQALRELSPEDKELLADAAPLLEAISEDAMAEDFAADVRDLMNDAVGPVPRNAPPLPGVTRTFSRISKMKQVYDRLVSTTATVFDSKEIKTVRLGLTIGTVFSPLIALGLRLLGVF